MYYFHLEGQSLQFYSPCCGQRKRTETESILFAVTAEESDKSCDESGGKKCRKNNFKREYTKLRTMVPALGEREDLTKVSLLSPTLPWTLIGDSSNPFVFCCKTSQFLQPIFVNKRYRGWGIRLSVSNKLLNNQQKHIRKVGFLSHTVLSR